MTGDNGRLNIKQWSADDRPREKLLKKGVQTLSNAELLAILISSGTKEKTAVDLAKELLQDNANSLTALGKQTISNLVKHKGIGQARAITIVAALELGRRRKEEEPSSKVKITSSRHVYDYFYPLMSDLDHEEFYVLLLDRSNAVIREFRISQGGVSGTVVDPKIVFNKAIENLASGIILCHNHPSGNLKPSDSDQSITTKIREAGKLIEINLLDHIIFTDNSYFSFADEGLI